VVVATLIGCTPIWRCIAVLVIVLAWLCEMGIRRGWAKNLLVIVMVGCKTSLVVINMVFRHEEAPSSYCASLLTTGGLLFLCFNGTRIGEALEAE
jgi:hypothetical protein